MWSDNPVHTEFAPRPSRLPADPNHYHVHTPTASASILDTASSPNHNVKPRPGRACDLCRRRKTKCDGLSAPDSICSNCVQNNHSCTYLCAYICVSCYLSLFLISPQRSLSPKRSTKSVRPIHPLPLVCSLLAYATPLLQLCLRPRRPPGEDGSITQESAYNLSLLTLRPSEAKQPVIQLRPEVDFTQHLGPPIVKDSWKSDPSTSAPRLLVKKESRPTSLNLLDHSFKARRKSSDSEPTDALSSDDDDPPFECAKRKLNAPGYSDDETEKDDGDTGVDPGKRLYGKSADIHLVAPTVFWKHAHINEVTPSGPQPEAHPPDPGMFPKLRRPIYWGPPFPVSDHPSILLYASMDHLITTNKWELEWEGVHVTRPAHFRSVRDAFPSRELAEELIDLYFTHVNVVYPLFHRPTFYDHWNEGLQHRDVYFTCVCMLVFAVASRWSTDPRVIGVPSSTEPGRPPRYRKAGWHFFNATIGTWLNSYSITS